jgi:hypothetical protein
LDEDEENGAGGPGAATGAAKDGGGVSAPLPAQPAAASGAATEDALDFTGTPAAVHLEPLAKLFGHITSAVSRSPRGWWLYARVQEARGRGADATECRLRQCRSLQAAGWEKDSAAVEALAKASQELVADYLADGSARVLMAARLHVAGVVGKVDAAAVQRHAPGVDDLRALLTRVQAAEAAAAAAAAAQRSTQ